MSNTAYSLNKSAIARARSVLSRNGVDVSLCLAAAESNARGNGGSTIRFEVVGENFHHRTVDAIIDTGHLLPHTFAY